MCLGPYLTSQQSCSSRLVVAAVTAVVVAVVVAAVSSR